MPRHNKPTKKERDSSSSGTEEVLIKINHHHKKHSESSDSSSSDIETYTNKKHNRKVSSSSSEKKHKHTKKCSPKAEKKCSPASEKKHCKKDSSSSSSSESEEKKHSSESEHKDKCSFEEIYKYYKYRLLTDDELQVGGSNAYIAATSTSEEVIPQIHPAEFENVSINYNIDHPKFGSPFYVREDGVYVLFFIVGTDQPSQFCIYVNGIEQPLTRYGNNSGAGQLVIRNMLQLKKDDAVLVRNSISTSATVVAPLFYGGLQSANPLTLLLMKIAPYCSPKVLPWNNECLSKRKHYLYKKLVEKMLCDKELMVQGFNVHGSFYTKVGQSVATEANVLYDSSEVVNGLSWSSSNPDQVVVNEDGVYKLFFLATTQTAVQFTMFVNGVALDNTTQGLNRGAGQCTLRILVSLKANDVITVKNHTSSVSNQVVLSDHCGGSQASVSAILTVFKVAPSCKPNLDVCKLNSYHKKCYEKFKQYLLHRDCLQITGSSTHFSLSGDVNQLINAGDAFELPNVGLINGNVLYTPGKPEITILEDGIYDLFADILTNEPSQITLFVNGTPDLSTVFGRDSGASRCLLRQFIKLRKGDVIYLANYLSNSGTISSQQSAGGQLAAQNCLFMTFKLSPLLPESNSPCKVQKNSKKNSKKNKSKESK